MTPFWGEEVFRKIATITVIYTRKSIVQVHNFLIMVKKCVMIIGKQNSDKTVVVFFCIP